MSDKNFALCSVINKKYVEYLKVFAFSLIKHNPNFNQDYIVLYEDGDLDSDDFRGLKEVYNNFVFRPVPVESYSLLNTSDPRLRNGEHSRSIMKWTYYRLEMFNLVGYDFCIWCDTDMLVMKNLDELFNMSGLDDKIAGAEDLLVKGIFQKENRMDEYFTHDQINGGLIYVGKNMMCKKVYDDLLSLLPEAYRFVRNDQTMFIEYFGGQNKLEHVDYKFNVGRKFLERGRINLSEVHILHYPGKGKPTNPNKVASSHIFWHKVKAEMDSVMRERGK